MARNNNKSLDRRFSSNYMVLSPDQVGVIDLIRVLIFRDIEKRRFVDCPKDVLEEGSHRRWLIFISILVQKLLKSVEKPMASIGCAFEMGLNLVSCNRNVGVLFINSVRGNVVIPDRESAAFLSTIGNLDKRVELDSSIHHGDCRYYSALAIMASKVAYENRAYITTTVRDCWKMNFLETYDFWNDYQEKQSTQAFMLHETKADTIVVAFRGTEPFDAVAWCTDFDISWYELPGIANCKIHGGFMKALGLQKGEGWPKQQQQNKPLVAYYAIREKLRELLLQEEDSKTKYILTGHSLGGALAILFPAILILHEEFFLLQRLEGIYTFGQPRVGGEKFGAFMKEHLGKYGIKYLRFVYANDIVPRLPYDDKKLMFKHFGRCLYYDCSYTGKVVEEEPNKNYFSPLMAIPKTIHAIRELFRSFMIPHQRGSDYREGWFLRMFRVFGLIVPGMSAHSPHDYVNATRLMSSASFAQLLDQTHAGNLLVASIDDTKNNTNNPQK